MTEDLLGVTKGPSVVTDWDTKDNVPTQKTPRKELVSVTSPVDVFTEVPTDVGAKLEDKCSTGSHDCSSNGTCIPREGSYDCECNLGYEGDGRICAGMFIRFVLYYEANARNVSNKLETFSSQIVADFLSRFWTKRLLRTENVWTDASALVLATNFLIRISYLLMSCVRSTNEKARN